MSWQPHWRRFSPDAQAWPAEAYQAVVGPEDSRVWAFGPWLGQLVVLDSAVRAVFWKRSRSRPTEDRLVQPARDTYPGAGAWAVANGECRGLGAAVSLLDEQDWAQIEALLCGRSDAESILGWDDALVALIEALDQLQGMVGGQQLVGVKQVTNQLVDPWAIAEHVGPEVAIPAEVLLSGLVRRDLISVDEINAVCHQTDAALTRMSGRATHSVSADTKLENGTAGCADDPDRGRHRHPAVGGGCASDLSKPPALDCSSCRQRAAGRIRGRHDGAAVRQVRRRRLLNPPQEELESVLAGRAW